MSAFPTLVLPRPYNSAITRLQGVLASAVSVAHSNPALGLSSRQIGPKTSVSSRHSAIGPTKQSLWRTQLRWGQASSVTAHNATATSTPRLYCVWHQSTTIRSKYPPRSTRGLLFVHALATQQRRTTPPQHSQTAPLHTGKRDGAYIIPPPIHLATPP
jgi:hypothetical protein